MLNLRIHGIIKPFLREKKEKNKTKTKKSPVTYNTLKLGIFSVLMKFRQKAIPKMSCNIQAHLNIRTHVHTLSMLLMASIYNTDILDFAGHSKLAKGNKKHEAIFYEVLLKELQKYSSFYAIP